MDEKIVLELDQKVIDQQSTLEKAGVSGFYITTNPQVGLWAGGARSDSHLGLRSLVFKKKSLALHEFCMAGSERTTHPLPCQLMGLVPWVDLATKGQKPLRQGEIPSCPQRCSQCGGKKRRAGSLQSRDSGRGLNDTKVRGRVGCTSPSCTDGFHEAFSWGIVLIPAHDLQETMISGWD